VNSELSAALEVLLDPQSAPQLLINFHAIAQSAAVSVMFVASLNLQR
jgi:hypothetical protein